MPFFLFLLLLLGGFQSIPILAGSDTTAVNQAGLQRTRGEVIAKNVLILQYRPATARPQAISDLETTLPLWEQEQTTLANDVRPDVQIIVTEIRPDYLAMDTAVRAILAHPDGPTDPVQVSIILMHDRQYVVSMNEIVLILQQSADRRTTSLFVIESVIDLFFLIICVVYGLREDRLLTRLAKGQDANNVP